MKTAFALSAVLLAYVAAQAEEAAQVVEEVTQAQVDPVSGKVWDRHALEWVPLHEFSRRTQQRGTIHIEQVPFVPPAINNGLDVLAKRQDAVRRHWEHVLYLQEITNTPLRFR